MLRVIIYVAGQREQGQVMFDPTHVGVQVMKFEYAVRCGEFMSVTWSRVLLRAQNLLGSKQGEGTGARFSEVKLGQIRGQKR